MVERLLSSENIFKDLRNMWGMVPTSDNFNLQLSFYNSEMTSSISFYYAVYELLSFGFHGDNDKSFLYFRAVVRNAGPLELVTSEKPTYINSC